MPDSQRIQVVTNRNNIRHQWQQPSSSRSKSNVTDGCGSAGKGRPGQRNGIGGKHGGRSAVSVDLSLCCRTLLAWHACHCRLRCTCDSPLASAPHPQQEDPKDSMKCTADT